jgi:hypothetical protein
MNPGSLDLRAPVYVVRYSNSGYSALSSSATSGTDFAGSPASPACEPQGARLIWADSYNYVFHSSDDELSRGAFSRPDRTVTET